MEGSQRRTRYTLETMTMSAGKNRIFLREYHRGLSWRRSWQQRLRLEILVTTYGI